MPYHYVSNFKIEAVASGEINPFMLNFPILINWTSPFLILGLLGGIFHFYSNF